MMKRIVAFVAFFWLFAVLTNAQEEYCYNKMVEGCRNIASLDNIHCTSTFSGFPERVTHLQSYANHQLEKSFDLLVLATNFGNYVKNRPGFEKQFRSLSDRAWEDGINLIKKISERGGSHDFNIKMPFKPIQQNKTLGLDELDSMAYALDVEKELAREAHNIHHLYSFSGVHKNKAGLDGEKELNEHANNGHQKSHYDPEITFWLEEHYLEKQAEIIRKLSGYSNDIKRLIGDKTDKSLALYLFDEYLQSE